MRETASPGLAFPHSFPASAALANRKDGSGAVEVSLSELGTYTAYYVVQPRHVLSNVIATFTVAVPKEYNRA